MNRLFAPILATALAIGFSTARGQEEMNHDAMPGMDHDSMPGMNDTDAESSMRHDSDTSDRDPHAYADGYDFGPIPRPKLADEHNFGLLLVDRLEGVRTDDDGWAAYDLLGWFGRAYDRVVVKAEGEFDSGEFEDARTELLWGHAVATYWDTQLGLRYDSGSAQPDRPWLALGIQGLAPYWFEFQATAYVGEEDRTGLRLEAEYELLFTQKLILQPRFEANLYGRSDDERRLGSGLSDLAAGLRLRYEFRREFAPYLGIEWAGKYGGTADRARDANLDANEMRTVAGVRFWF